MRRFVLPSLLCCVLALPVVAKEKRPSEQFAEKEKAFLRAIAAKYVELGDEARKQKLYRFAREAYDEAIEYEENNRDARKQLGYVRKGREWVIDPSEARKLPEENTKPQNMHQSDFDKIVEKFEKSKSKVEVFVGKKYSGLGKWCDKEGLADQARKAWERAIRFDPDNETARKGLGYRKVEGKWMTEKQIRALKEAREGKLVNDSPSRFESGLGVKLNKMESAHFRIETVFPPDQLREYVKACEQTYAYFLRDVGEPELRNIFGKRATLLVLDTQQQWHRYVDTFEGGSQREKDFTKKCQGTRQDGNLLGIQYLGENDQGGVIDGLVHSTAHFLVQVYWNIGDRAWLKEGFAYYYTMKVLESTRRFCVALGSYDHPGGGMKDWGESSEWKDLLKKEVAGHGDPDLRVFYRQKTQDLQFRASVKSWSMISWLFDKHRENFMKWLDAVGRGGRDEEKSFQEFFGWSFEEVDKAWREYVLENY